MASCANAPRVYTSAPPKAAPLKSTSAIEAATCERSARPPPANCCTSSGGSADVPETLEPPLELGPLASAGFAQSGRSMREEAPGSGPGARARNGLCRAPLKARASRATRPRGACTNGRGRALRHQPGRRRALSCGCWREGVARSKPRSHRGHFPAVPQILRRDTLTWRRLVALARLMPGDKAQQFGRAGRKKRRRRRRRRGAARARVLISFTTAFWAP